MLALLSTLCTWPLRCVAQCLTSHLPVVPEMVHIWPERQVHWPLQLLTATPQGGSCREHRRGCKRMPLQMWRTCRGIRGQCNRRSAAAAVQSGPRAPCRPCPGSGPKLTTHTPFLHCPTLPGPQRPMAFGTHVSPESFSHSLQVT